MIKTMVKERLSGDDITVQPADTPVFMPKDILTYLFQNLAMDIPTAAIKKFWDHAWEFDCPYKHLSVDRTHVPIALYGDSARYSPDGRKMIAVFMSVVLWVPRVSRMSRWLLFTVENDLCLGPQTLNPLFRVIVENLISCYQDGITVGDTRLHFATTELRGDWEWHAYTFSMMRNWKHHKFCWRCEATKFDHPNFLDLDDEPGWAATQLSPLQFLVRIIPSSNVRLFTRSIWQLFELVTPPQTFFLGVCVHMYGVGTDVVPMLEPKVR